MIGWQVHDDDEQTRKIIHALSGINTLGLRAEVIKAYATDRAATGTGKANQNTSCTWEIWMQTQ
jgi:hypothetical protein